MFKAIAFILAGKDAQKVYRAETGKDRPVYLSRKVWGAGITALGALLAWQFGVDSEPIARIAQGTDEILTKFNALYDLLINNKATVIAAWGGVIQLISYGKEIGKLIKAKKNV